MIELEAVGDRITIHSDVPVRDRDRIKLVPGARYDQKLDQWWAPLTWASCVTLRGVFSDEIVIKESLFEWATKEREQRIDPAMAMRASMEADGDEDLYPFQRACVKFLAYARRALLCDPMGSGKTPSVIRTLAEISRRGENPFPAIVVCPNNMVYTWKKEIEKFWPGVDAAVVKGTQKAKLEAIQGNHHVTIINFESLRTFSRLAPYGSIKLKRCIVCDPTLPDVASNKQSRCEWCKKPLNLKPWKTVIVDEAHRMKSPSAKQTRACWALRTDATEFVYGLTGTAIADSPDDMWPTLHLISEDEHPSRQRYIDRYCLLSWNPFGTTQVVGLRPEVKNEFFQIVDPRMRRMPKEAILPFLPDKTYSERIVEMAPKQAKAYEQMSEKMLAQIDGAVVAAFNPLVKLTRLTQFASAYAEVDPESGDVRLTNPSNKVDALVEILEEMGDKPAVVFAQSRQLIELATAKLESLKISHAMIVGGQTAEQREINKESFQNGNVRVILCTIAAGGIGITLTRADTAIFLQRSWSMIDNSQAEDRVHRIGSEIHDKVEIIDIISAGTIEIAQRQVLAGKEERLQEVMRDEETLRKLTHGEVF